MEDKNDNLKPFHSGLKTGAYYDGPGGAAEKSAGPSVFDGASEYFKDISPPEGALSQIGRDKVLTMAIYMGLKARTSKRTQHAVDARNDRKTIRAFAVHLTADFMPDVTEEELDLATTDAEYMLDWDLPEVLWTMLEAKAYLI